MSVKILSQAGISLADTYDVQGSIAGIEELESAEVTLVHEMGNTIFAERVSGFIRRVTTAALNQNATWDLVLNDLPDGPFRILNVLVLANTSSRINRAQVSIRDDDGGREMPFFIWETSNDVESAIRIVENNGASANQTALVVRTGLPSMGIGFNQPQRVNAIAFRGLTSGFGAGTVTVVALVYLAFSAVGGISSRGLPVPSW